MQETAFSVPIVPGMRFLAHTFGVYRAMAESRIAVTYHDFISQCHGPSSTAHEQRLLARDTAGT
eukprot:1201794-Rhodomonas_salina.4